MEERFTWKAEIQFTGTADQFNKLAELLEAQPVAIGIAEWANIRRPHLAGCNPFPIDKLLDRVRLEKIIANQPRAQLRFIKDIRGGIRTAHLHLADEVVLLSRDRFKLLVGEVASALAIDRVENVSDYIGVMTPVGDLADYPIPVP